VKVKSTDVAAPTTLTGTATGSGARDGFTPVVSSVDETYVVSSSLPLNRIRLDAVNPVP
jgi:hypothetical protein